MANEKEKDPDADAKLYKRILDYKVKWEGFAHKELDKVNTFRDYIYNTTEEEGTINFAHDAKTNDSKVTLSPLRTVCNRVKSDLRDLSPQLQATPKKPERDENARKIYQSILKQPWCRS